MSIVNDNVNILSVLKQKDPSNCSSIRYTFSSTSGILGTFKELTFAFDWEYITVIGINLLPWASLMSAVWKSNLVIEFEFP